MDKLHRSCTTLLRMEGLTDVAIELIVLRLRNLLDGTVLDHAREPRAALRRVAVVCDPTAGRVRVVSRRRSEVLVLEDGPLARVGVVVDDQASLATVVVVDVLVRSAHPRPLAIEAVVAQFTKALLHSLVLEETDVLLVGDLGDGHVDDGLAKVVVHFGRGERLEVRGVGAVDLVVVCLASVLGVGVLVGAPEDHKLVAVWHPDGLWCPCHSELGRHDFDKARLRPLREAGTLGLPDNEAAAEEVAVEPTGSSLVEIRGDDVVLRFVWLRGQVEVSYTSSTDRRSQQRGAIVHGLVVQEVVAIAEVAKDLLTRWVGVVLARAIVVIVEVKEEVAHVLLVGGGLSAHERRFRHRGCSSRHLQAKADADGG